MASPAEGDEVTADELETDVPFNAALARAAAEVSAQPVAKTPAERKDEAEAQVAEANAKWADQRTTWRRVLFWGVAGMVALVGASALAAGWAYLLMMGTDAHPGVIGAWIGSSVAQVVGLLVVITRHLFPSTDK